jgi:cellulose synthase/poly-beta-1,6-N-acetylglucosamine synthase-like glycosyltransferase
MNFYGFKFTFFEIILLGILLLTFFYQLFFYIRYTHGVLRLKKKINKNKVNFLTEQPPVSVIICARDEADNLRKFLPFILAQDYSDFEVIVVNDGSVDETDILLNDMKINHPNLRTTFVPIGVTNLSTKKLALTLGVKAAKNDILLFTDADCMPEDKFWIARMARNFTPGIEFVLGYGAYLHQKSFINKLITYDTLFIALQYLGFAYAGKPYMGVGRNMAYRKEAFFRQKGYASTLHLRSGDDDLMVNQAATRFNTKIEIAPDSVTWSEPKTSFKDWYYQKERHLSVSSYYSGLSRSRLAIEPISRGLFYLSFILTMIFGNLITLIAAGVIILVRYFVQMSVINNSAKHFAERRYYINILVFDIILPIINLYILSFGRMGSKAKNIRWK